MLRISIDKANPEIGITETISEIQVLESIKRQINNLTKLPLDFRLGDIETKAVELAQITNHDVLIVPKIQTLARIFGINSPYKAYGYNNLVRYVKIRMEGYSENLLSLSSWAEKEFQIDPNKNGRLQTLENKDDCDFIVIDLKTMTTEAYQRCSEIALSLPQLIVAIHTTAICADPEVVLVCGLDDVTDANNTFRVTLKKLQQYGKWICSIEDQPFMTGLTPVMLI